MKFRTKYTSPLNIVSNSGTGVIDVFKVKLNKNGVRKIVKAGVDNIYKKIQASAESVDINTILTKFLNTGDKSLLYTNPGAYVDITNMPTSMFEAINQINESKDIFNKLPVDIKKKFDNDFEKFIVNAGKIDWYDKLGLVKYSDKENKEEVIKEASSKQKVEEKEKVNE